MSELRRTSDTSVTLLECFRFLLPFTFTSQHVFDKGEKERKNAATAPK